MSSSTIITNHHINGTTSTNYITLATTVYILNVDNCQECIPNGVTDVIISHNLPREIYRTVFRPRDEYGRELWSNDHVKRIKSITKYNVILQDSITDIRDYTFYECYLIKSITIPSSVRTVGKSAFCGCRSLETVDMTQATNLQVIGVGSFRDCSMLKQICIPPSVTRIGKYAFRGCRSLERVNLSQATSLQVVHPWLFSDCSMLKQIYTPPYVTRIEKYAFRNCFSLLSIIIPDTVVDIGKGAFDHCCNLQNILIPKNCNYDISIFSSTTKVIKHNHIDTFKGLEGQQNLLKNRFDNLSTHQQLYNNHNIDEEQLETLPLLELQGHDSLNMTILHILCCNPATNLNIIQVLCAECPAMAFVENLNHMFPVEMYLLSKGIVQLLLSNKNEDDGEVREIVYDQTEEMDKIRMLMQLHTQYNLNEIIKFGIKREFWDILLSFQGLSFDEAVYKSDQATGQATTGFYPFMNAAISTQLSLESVYELAMKVPHKVCV